MKIHIGMMLQQVLEDILFVRRKVVQDDVHLAPEGLGRNDFFQEHNKLLTGRSWGDLAEDFAGWWIQRHIQRERLMLKHSKPCFQPALGITASGGRAGPTLEWHSSHLHRTLRRFVVDSDTAQ